MSLFHCELQPSVYIHVLERQDSCLFGTKMKVSQLGRKLECEHFVSQQDGDIQGKYAVW